MNTFKRRTISRDIFYSLAVIGYEVLDWIVLALSFQWLAVVKWAVTLRVVFQTVI